MKKTTNKRIMRDKHGWIRVVEAFTAILLIAGVALVIMGEGYIGKKDISKKIYEEENAILREIQLNDSLRNEILSAPGPLPINWTNLPPNTRDLIQDQTPSYLGCEAKICEIGDDCFLGKIMNTDIYARNVVITSTQTSYNPRQLKMFCWLKEG